MDGKEYNFLKNERVPQWMFNSEVAFFGADAKVVAYKEKTVVSGTVKKGEALIEIRNKNGQHSTQVCPQIHFIIEPNTKPFDFKDINYNPYKDLSGIWK